MQRIIVSILPKDFHTTAMELIRRGAVIIRRSKDSGVIAAEVDAGQIAEIRALRGVQDVEVEHNPRREK
jgi:hypothetical protein